MLRIIKDCQSVCPVLGNLGILRFLAQETAYYRPAAARYVRQGRRTLQRGRARARAATAAALPLGFGRPARVDTGKRGRLPMAPECPLAAARARIRRPTDLQAGCLHRRRPLRPARASADACPWHPSAHSLPLGLGRPAGSQATDLTCGRIRSCGTGRSNRVRCWPAKSGRHRRGLPPSPWPSAGRPQPARHRGPTPPGRAIAWGRKQGRRDYGAGQGTRRPAAPAEGSK